MPLPHGDLTGGLNKRLFLLGLLGLGALCAAWLGAPLRAQAAANPNPIHASADREVWDRKANRVELFGHAVVRQPGETLTADHITMDQAARTLDAYGNCVYIASDSVIYGEEMHFNLDTRTGTIISGRVATDQFTLGGERINKLGAGRFQTHWGEYSTCRDCPNSWSLQAQDVDMQIEGYAFLKNVALKVKDTPTVWMPFFVVPLKTHRQSGILFPSFTFSGGSGAGFLLPYFWAIDRSYDMTFGLGTFTSRGGRFHWEGRYALSPRSQGRFNFYSLVDSLFTDPVDNPSLNKWRWAFRAQQTQELPWGIEAKLNLTEVSDNYYLASVASNDPTQAELPQNEMVLPSSLSLNYASSDVSGYVAAVRYRNLLDVGAATDTERRGIRRFDPTTVQAIPTAAVTTNDRTILAPSVLGSPVVGGLTLGVTNFTRSAGPFDLELGGDPTRAPTPGTDPIREATRFSFVPSLYTSFRPWDRFTLTPSVRYFGYYYSFGTALEPLYRGYMLFQTDLSAQLERIFDKADPNRPRVKHTIQPVLTYSYIPRALVQPQSISSGAKHPFLQQIERRAGYYFDNQDLVPLDRSPSETFGDPTQSYFVPLGNSLSVGFRTQLIERVGKLTDDRAAYRVPLDFTAGESINFREYELYGDEARAADPSLSRGPRPLSRFFSTLKLNYEDRLTSDTTYFYYPYISGIRHFISTTAAYVFERGMRQRILTFDRSLALTYTWNRVGCPADNCPQISTLISTLNFSLSDYVMPSLAATYNMQTRTLEAATGGILFQSPSQCWRANLNASYKPDPQTGPGVSIGFNFALNLTGAGFESPTEALGPTAR